uniref:Uncharacterized protein n=1 Tax=Sphaerodactylus townsendi TaxID=933632 RepID=A0ACB8EZZ9_9SAUR
MVRLKCTAQQWFRATNVKSVEQACQLIVKEQFFQILPEDISTIVQSKDGFDLSELAAFTDHMTSIKSKGKKGFISPQGSKCILRLLSRLLNQAIKAFAPKRDSPWKPSRLTESSIPKVIVCFNCKRERHFCNNCPDLNKETKIQLFEGGRILQQTENWECRTSSSHDNSSQSNSEDEPMEVV